MAKICALCDKKIGLFATFGDDIITGSTDGKICAECMKKIEVLDKKSAAKVLFTAEDFEGFSESGAESVRNFFLDDSSLEEILVEDPTEEKSDVMELEIGEATLTPDFVVDEEETQKIYEKMLSIHDGGIEEYLEGLVNNTSADAFIREILALDDDELASVLADQREYYNNAEWAYIMLVDYRRRQLKNPEDFAEEKEQLPEVDPDGLDTAEVERMKEKFADNEKGELEQIIGDSDYTVEARFAAQELLKTK